MQPSRSSVSTGWPATPWPTERSHTTGRVTVIKRSSCHDSERSRWLHRLVMRIRRVVSYNRPSGPAMLHPPSCGFGGGSRLRGERSGAGPYRSKQKRKILQPSSWYASLKFLSFISANVDVALTRITKNHLSAQWQPKKLFQLVNFLQTLKQQSARRFAHHPLHQSDWQTNPGRLHAPQ
jgi:hypothetical protein